MSGTVAERHLHGVFSIVGPQTSCEVIMGFSLECSGGTDRDFGNSGHLNFVLPDDVT